ncbi:MAG: alanine--tRNA ligase [Chloroflexota bacterium]
MNSENIRQSFVDFFVERSHAHLPGLPLVTNDPSVTTLFTIAGMQQMIPYFMGRETPPNPNMVTVQQTMRTDDIEEVGDNSHCTFFEMLGNFSVGQYFKEEAIRFTWDFLTGVMSIPAEKWWAVTYPGDDEARQAWVDVGVPADRIGETASNWWGPPGSEGPCGPNSEIHYDRGIQYSCGRPDCSPAIECCSRFVEVWNDVFMSYYQDTSGERRPLPWNNVDTGMGFERLVTVVQGVETVYETDLYRPIIAELTGITGAKYSQNASTDRSLRIISDHARAITFIANAGVMPSAQGRGYVLRRLIRRAALHGKLLGVEEPFLTRPIEAVIRVMAHFYGSLQDRQESILQVIRTEEERFLLTLGRGLTIFEEMAQRSAADNKLLGGQDAFQLYDTHGFPLEMTEELARERGLNVDRADFTRHLEEQRARARERRTRRTIGTTPETYSSLSGSVAPTVFTGYDVLRTTSTVAAIIAGGESVSRADAGDRAEVILVSSPFYAESGGQVGDTGLIRGESGEARVIDTQRFAAPYISHIVQVERGSLAVGDVIEAEVDTERRLHILPHHSGTHLLHKALQEVLGREAVQAGSLVSPDRLRFDFRWSRALTEEELRDVQDRVNASIWANLPVRSEVKPFPEAVEDGAMALFGEKYGELVRVVSIGEWSKELCGGTHVDASGDIGLLIILAETGIGSSIRRIEALAGAAAYAHIVSLRDQISSVASVLDSGADNVLQRADHVMALLRKQEQRIVTLTNRLAAMEADSLLLRARTVNNVTIVAEVISADSADYLEATVDAIKGKIDEGVVLLASVVGDSAQFRISVSPNLAATGVRADDILKEATKRVQGKPSAGGTPQFAKGGGKDPAQMKEVVQTALALVRQKVED